MMRTLLILSLLLLAMLPEAFGQKFRTPRGQEFWVGYMNNNIDTRPENPLRLSLHLFADEPLQVIIEIPGLKFRKTVTVNGYLNYAFDKDPDAVRAGIRDSLENVRSGMVQPLGVRVFTKDKKDFFLNLSNRRMYTFDVAMALPYWALGKEYLVPSYGEPFSDGSPSKTEFMVVATEDSTEITVTSTATIFQDGPRIPIMRKGIPFTIKLNRGETFHAMSNGDLTGTAISSDQPIALYSGNQCTNVGGQPSCDHLYESVLPVPQADIEDLFTRYILSTTYNRPFDLVRVMALKENTTITINTVHGQQTKTLALKGSFTDFDIATQNVGTALLTSDKPVYVWQMIISDNADGTSDNNADPAMAMLVPEALAQPYNGFFYMMDLQRESGGQNWSNFLNLIFTTNDENMIRVNGRTLAENRAFIRFVPGDTNRKVATIDFVGDEIKNMVSLQCADCIGYVYGLADDDSYSTTAQVCRMPVVNEANLTSADEHVVPAVSALTLSPNPLNSGDGTVSVQLTEGGQTDVSLTDLQGRTVVQYSQMCSAGRVVLPVPAAGLEKGIYFLKVKTSSGQATAKIVISE